MNPNKPPHTYPPGFSKAIIAEYLMRYRLLYKIKQGIPIPADKNLYSYFRLKLIEKTETGLKITDHAEVLFFTPQIFE